MKNLENQNLENFDRQVFEIIQKEQNRQEREINLIASENYASWAVLQASASVLTNKYAEGTPGKRYYAGCRFIDEVEKVAIERCKNLFDFKDGHANVQPHAGSQANMAVYFSMLNPGDTIMGMGLAEGGHLTHGHKVNFSGQVYKSVQYLVDKETDLINFDMVEEMAYAHKPKIIIAGATAYSREIDFKKFSEIAKSVGAYLLADIAHIAGLVATQLHQSPVGCADFITSTTHKTLRGPRGAFILSKEEYAKQMDAGVMPGIQGGPLMHVIAAKAVAFKEAGEQSFIAYQTQVIKNAKHFAKTLESLGYSIVTGGTDNHMFVVDLRSKNVTGRQTEVALEKAGITTSRSCIPYDPQKPWITSGVRIGTPAITTRGMKEPEVEIIAQLFDEVVQKCESEPCLLKIKDKAHSLCAKFPIY
ncbi:serine hydroxymethyltransferase [Candidatus Dependentiae bacterium]